MRRIKQRTAATSCHHVALKSILVTMLAILATATQGSLQGAPAPECPWYSIPMQPQKTWRDWEEQDEQDKSISVDDKLAELGLGEHGELGLDDYDDLVQPVQRDGQGEAKQMTTSMTFDGGLAAAWASATATAGQIADATATANAAAVLVHGEPPPGRFGTHATFSTESVAATAATAYGGYDPCDETQQVDVLEAAAAAAAALASEDSLSMDRSNYKSDLEYFQAIDKMLSPAKARSRSRGRNRT